MKCLFTTPLPWWCEESLLLITVFIPDEHFVSDFHQLSINIPGEGGALWLDDGCCFGVALLLALLFRPANEWAGTDSHCWHVVRLHEGEAELYRGTIRQWDKLTRTDRLILMESWCVCVWVCVSKVSRGQKSLLESSLGSSIITLHFI